MDKYRKPIAVVILGLIFTTWFAHSVKSDFNLIFKKDLLAHDESSNSVVAANITRKFFPPMVRVNPLVETQGNWMEGPYWQHIPPLYAYVPYLFFKLDGQVTVEMKRLSYAFVILLTGLIFIFSVYKFRKSLWAAASATLAAIFWVNTPFTHELITGYAFGVSDIVLAFTVVCGFGAILWYLNGRNGIKGDKGSDLWEGREGGSVGKLILISLLVALPIIAKNLLGAIPAATFFGLLLYDRRKIDKKVIASVIAFLGLLGAYLLTMYLSSPLTFKNEVVVGFLHFKNLEGWERPWCWYLTNYLPQRYLFGWTWIYYLGLMLGVIINFKLEILNRKDKILLGLSVGWFVWNLIAVSLVTSKVPNFIYQSYLLSLFFIIYSLATLGQRLFEGKEWKGSKGINAALIGLLIVSLLITSYEGIRFGMQFKVQRAQAYNYQSEHEKFYQTAEELKALGVDTRDIIIVRVSDNDCWFRYYPLFLTGTESKTLLEMYFGFNADIIKHQYNHMYFVMNKNDSLQDVVGGKRVALTNYSALGFDLNQMNSNEINETIKAFVYTYQRDIAQDILRIKKDKTSCQWLVPDPILNAP